MLSGPLPEFPFAQPGHDRLAERRHDETFLLELRAHPGTKVLVLSGEKLMTDGTGLRFLSPMAVDDAEWGLLGEWKGDHYLVAMLPDDAAETSEDWSDLRRLSPELDPIEAGLAVHAVALGGWHRRHPRCAVCGAPTQLAESGASRRCPECGAQHFPRTDPAVIMLVTDDSDRCLLGHNAARGREWYSTLAGFVEPGEAAELAVRREVHEETGIVVGDVRYAGSQPWPFPASLMLGFFAAADTTEVRVDGNEIDDARWFSRDELTRAINAGEVVVPTMISISGALITKWYGADLPPNRPR